MNNLTLPVLLGVLLVAVLLFGALPGSGLEEALTTRHPVEPSALEPSALEPLAAPIGDQREAAGARREQAAWRPPQQSDAANEGRVRVHGRCLDERGVPLAGVAVDLAVVRKRFGRRVTTAAVHESPRAYSDAGGRFAAVLAVPSYHEVRVRTRMPGRAGTQGCVPPGPRGTVDLGDIRLPQGAHLAATVVDRQGRRQPDVAFRLHRHDADPTSPVTPVDCHDVRSDPCGRFRTEVALAAGRWTLVPHGDVQLVEPAQHLDVSAGTTDQQTRIVVAPPNPQVVITGTLLDQRGAPVADIAIQARTGTGRLAGLGRSDDRGRFRIVRRADHDAPVRLVAQPTVGFEACSTRTLAHWGATGITLVRLRADDLRLTVVTETGDAPVEDFGVAWSFQDAQEQWHAGGRQWRTRHIDGRVILRGVPAGAVRVVVLPGGRTLAPSDPLVFHKPSGSADLRIELPRREALRVRVLDDAGLPVSDSLMQLVHSLDDRPVTLQSEVVDSGPRLGSPECPPVLQLDSVRTDTEGRATLYWRPRSGRIAIRVLGPGHVPTVYTPVVVRADSTSTIRVTRGATLRGTVASFAVRSRPAESTWHSRPRVVLQPRGPGSTAFPITAPIDADGAFMVQGLAPGPWEVSLRTGRPAAGGAARRPRATHRIWLGADEDRRVDLDIATK